MSLIVDPDYLIHSLRLAYLRRIDDNHGPRVITFPSIRTGHKSGDAETSSDGQLGGSLLSELYGRDTHVVMAGLTDVTRHPELTTTYSPSSTAGGLGAFGGYGARSSSTDSSKHDTSYKNEASGSRLGYTNTIYGAGRSGALGMRVNGRRASKRVSVAKGVPPSAIEQGKDSDESRSPAPPPVTIISSDGEPSTEASTHLHPSKPVEPSAALSKRVLFAQSPQSPPPPPSTHAEFTQGSTESHNAMSSLESAVSLPVGSLEVPLLNAAITGDTHSHQSTAPAQQQQQQQQQDQDLPTQTTLFHADTSDQGLQLPKMKVSNASHPQDSDQESDPDTPVRHSARAPTKTIAKKRSRSILSPEYFAAARTSRDEVEKRHARRPQVSALSARLAKQDSGPENPLAAFYAGIAGRAGTVPSMTVDIYFPWANAKQLPAASPPTSGAISVNAKTKSMKLDIRKDATMEEVIGYGLYCYVEERWQPELGSAASSAEEKEVKTTTIGYTLMIVEEGEVDDDFPAIDQSLWLGKFGGDEFAICEATPRQIKQHRDIHGTLARRASRVTAASAKPTRMGAGESAHASTPANGDIPATAVSGNPGLAARLGVSASGMPVSSEGTPILASGALSKSALGSSSQSIFLRVLVTPNPEVRYKTTLQVPSDMYLADVLEMICRKRHLSKVDEWALIVPDKSIVVPLDRTVESLQGNHDLALVRRSSLGVLGGTGVLSGSSTNPNASIFKRYSTTSESSGAAGGQPKYTKALDIAAAYKSFTVYRKSPMFGGRHNERSLTLDGDWLHIMPTEMKTIGKAASFHISSVVACKLSSKLANAFKLIVWRESPRDTKRYDFDTDSPRIAAEIVREINHLRAAQQ